MPSLCLGILLAGGCAHPKSIPPKMSESALGAFMPQLQPQGFLGCLVGNWAAWMGLQAGCFSSPCPTNLWSVVIQGRGTCRFNQFNPSVLPVFTHCCVSTNSTCFFFKPLMPAVGFFSLLPLCKKPPGAVWNPCSPKYAFNSDLLRWLLYR